MSDRHRIGQVAVILALSACLGVCIINSVLVVSIVGIHKLPSALVRVLLTVVLLYYTYLGSPVARWILIVLFVLGGGLSLFSSASNGFRSIMDFWLALMGIVFIAASGVLSVLPHAREFLMYRHRLRRRSTTE